MIFGRTDLVVTSLLPLWEKVAIGGLQPPFFDMNADASPRLWRRSVPDEGFYQRL
jgi:hypothetical protein